MKAVLNVDGEQLEVTNIYYANGEVRNVQVHLGNNVYQTYRHHEAWVLDLDDPMVNFNDALEFPGIKKIIEDEQNKLIEHLDKLIEKEDDELTNMAVETMNSDSGLPFGELSLENKQKEYKLTQQRVFGIIDAVEEVKAFLEGWYDSEKSTKSIEEKEHHQSIK